MARRPYYGGFSEHALRFYARTPVLSRGKTAEADIENWNACDNVFSELSAYEKDVLLIVFGSKRPIQDAVKTVTCRYSVSEGSVWKTIDKIQRMVAEKRGLI